ncbi:hypothetical protein SDC9_56574 [bioreactor metagenome]|uniref:Uncharacterized protein n=1 Tax=bioreactor metagenome TaxID=1076179 RepID=A0A644X299_9ZZZZ
MLNIVAQPGFLVFTHAFQPADFFVQKTIQFNTVFGSVADVPETVVFQIRPVVEMC